MSIFGGKLAGATPFGAGRFPVPGSYILDLQKLFLKPSQNPKKKLHNNLIGETTIVEFTGVTYVSVEVDKVTKLPKGEIDTTKAFKTGDSLSRVVDLDDPLYGMANAKEFLAAVVQAWRIKYDNIDCTYEQAMEELSTKEGEAFAEKLLNDAECQKKVKGLLLRLEAWATTKNDGTEDFTATKYSAYVPGTESTPY